MVKKRFFEKEATRNNGDKKYTKLLYGTILQTS
jgi:hypothetical protein